MRKNFGLQEETRHAAEYLRSHRFFSGFDLTELSFLLTHLRLRKISAGRKIVELREVPMLLMLTGKAELQRVNGSRKCERGMVLSRHWAGPNDGHLFAKTDVSVLDLTEKEHLRLRLEHPSMTRRLQQRLAATGAQISPIGSVWAGRRMFYKRSRRPKSNEDRAPAFALVTHSRMILSIV